jgi:hypothetical protein
MHLQYLELFDAASNASVLHTLYVGVAFSYLVLTYKSFRTDSDLQSSVCASFPLSFICPDMIYNLGHGYEFFRNSEALITRGR